MEATMAAKITAVPEDNLHGGPADKIDGFLAKVGLDLAP
jgi:hypothetical protein